MISEVDFFVISQLFERLYKEQINYDLACTLLREYMEIQVKENKKGV